MSDFSQSFWTYQVTNSTLTIDESMGIGMVSVMLTSGSGTVSGSTQAGIYPSQSLQLTAGMPLTFGGNSTRVITGLTIDASPTGNIYVIGR
jgi:hypothetical protein